MDPVDKKKTDLVREVMAVREGHVDVSQREESSGDVD